MNKKGPSGWDRTASEMNYVAGATRPQAVNPVEQDSFFPLKKKGTVI